MTLCKCLGKIGKRPPEKPSTACPKEVISASAVPSGGTDLIGHTRDVVRKIESFTYSIFPILNEMEFMKY